MVNVKSKNDMLDKGFKVLKWLLWLIVFWDLSIATYGFELKVDERTWYLGCGEPLMGFWPYLRHEYSSGGMSANLLLIARTVIVVFNRSFLFTQTSSLQL